jgi:hypothetical protein
MRYRIAFARPTHIYIKIVFITFTQNRHDCILLMFTPSSAKILSTLANEPTSLLTWKHSEALLASFYRHYHA